MSTPKIRNLESLEIEINRLKRRQEEIELTLDKNIMGFPKNVGSMTMQSILQSDLVQAVVSGNFWTNLFVRLLQNKKLQDGLGKLVDTITDKVGGGLDKVATKIHP